MQMFCDHLISKCQVHYRYYRFTLFAQILLSVGKMLQCMFYQYDLEYTTFTLKHIIFQYTHVCHF